MNTTHQLQLQLNDVERSMLPIEGQRLAANNRAVRLEAQIDELQATGPDTPETTMKIMRLRCDIKAAESDQATAEMELTQLMYELIELNQQLEELRRDETVSSLLQTLGVPAGLLDNLSMDGMVLIARG